jgi:hypothetical protein
MGQNVARVANHERAAVDTETSDVLTLSHGRSVSFEFKLDLCDQTILSAVCIHFMATIPSGGSEYHGETFVSL